MGLFKLRKEIEALDPLPAAAMITMLDAAHLGKTDPNDPDSLADPRRCDRISPAFVLAGSNEGVYDDSTRLVEKLEDTRGWTSGSRSARTHLTSGQSSLSARSPSPDQPNWGIRAQFSTISLHHSPPLSGGARSSWRIRIVHQKVIHPSLVPYETT